MPALISHPHRQAIVAYDKGRAIPAHEYLAAVRHMVGLLPQQGYVLNLCSNRYHFAVVMGAALLLRQPMLLPSTRSPAMVQQLSQHYPGLYAVVDQTDPSLTGLHQIAYPADSQTPGETDLSFVVPEIDADQIAAYVFTSGSTGQPVPHVKRWGQMVTIAQAEGSRVRQHLLAGHDARATFTVTGTVPAQHMYGFESTILLPLQNQAAVDAGHPFYPADIAQALHRVPAPRVLVTTPFHLRTLIESRATVPALNLLLSATAPLSPQLADQAEKTLGAPLLEIYGCTETGQIATRRTTQTQVWQTHENVEVHQQTSANDEPLFVAQGGYVEGSVPLGDVLELHSSTTFILLGRQADLVNIAGKRTSMGYLNHELNSIKGVTDGAFYLPDNDGLDAQAKIQRPIAFVVAPNLSLNDVNRALRERIDPIFMPRPIFFLDHLPRNATGKLPREVLANLAQTLKESGRG